MLDDPTAAEVLLRIGVLTGWIGSIKLIKGSQQLARILLGDSITLFESLSDPKKTAEAQIESALCSMREGSLDVARELYVDALSRLDDQDGDLKALGMLRLAMVELLTNRLKDSFQILNTARRISQRVWARTPKPRQRYESTGVHGAGSQRISGVDFSF